MAHTHGWTAVVSHRSGETDDATIADLSVALNTGQIKPCSLPGRSCRQVQPALSASEEELGDEAVYGGPALLARLGK
jgi:enolase